MNLGSIRAKIIPGELRLSAPLRVARVRIVDGAVILVQGPAFRMGPVSPETAPGEAVAPPDRFAADGSAQRAGMRAGIGSAEIIPGMVPERLLRFSDGAASGSLVDDVVGPLRSEGIVTLSFAGAAAGSAGFMDRDAAGLSALDAGDVIDVEKMERDFRERSVPNFSHPARGR